MNGKVQEMKRMTGTKKVGEFFKAQNGTHKWQDLNKRVFHKEKQYMLQGMRFSYEPRMELLSVGMAGGYVLYMYTV